MDAPFIYDKYVTGKNFIGRKGETSALVNLLQQGENVVLYEPPKTGKMSLIQQALFNMRVGGKAFSAGMLSLLNIRTEAAFLARYGAAVIRLVAGTPAEYAAVAGQYLDGTHIGFDEAAFAERDEVLTCRGEVDEEDIRTVLRLPHRIAADRGERIILVISDFQGITLVEDDGDRILRALEAAIREEPRGGVSYVFSGSMVNAMKRLFEVRGWCHRRVEHLCLKPVDEREITEYIARGFSASGKVSDKDLLLGVCKRFRNHLWYINHFVAICDALSKGYIMEPILIEGLSCILAVHEPRFRAVMDDLTTHQVNLLKAIVDGHSKFSSSGVIRAYGLNSSANVKRVKDALMKKEIVTFTEQDDPVIIDPLFEYWVRRDYFEKKTGYDD